MSPLCAKCHLCLLLSEYELGNVLIRPRALNVYLKSTLCEYYLNGKNFEKYKVQTF